MSRKVSTIDRTAQISQMLKSGYCKSAYYLQYYDWENKNPTLLEDVDGNKGINWTEQKKRYKYASWLMTPQPGIVEFEVLNIAGKYSPGNSGSPVSGIFKLGTKIAVNAGYVLPTPEAGYAASVYSSYGYHVNGTTFPVALDIANVVGKPMLFTDQWKTLGDVLYSDKPAYEPAGMIVKTFGDFIKGGWTKATSFSVLANTTKARIYYRAFNTEYASSVLAGEITANWTSAGSTANGTVTITPGTATRFFQVAVIFDGTTWSAGDEVTDITLTVADYVEWVYRNVFYLDSPTYDDPGLMAVPRISCTGRDVLKKAIDIDITIPDSTVLADSYLHTLIKYLCTMLQIPFSATSIQYLYQFGARTLPAVDNSMVKGFDLFEQIGHVLMSGTPKYEMFTRYDATLDDNILYVQPIPADYSAVAVMSFRHFKTIGQFRQNYDQLLNRITVLSTAEGLASETLLNSVYDTWTAGETKVINFGGPAENKRVVFVPNVFPQNFQVTDIQPTQISVKSILAGSILVNVYGCLWSSTAPAAEGEWLNSDLMANGLGHTESIANPLIKDSAEATAIAKGFLEKFGIPSWESNQIKYPYPNLLYELEDITGLWSYNLWRDNLYFIVKIQHYISNAGGYSSYNMDDTGKNLSDLGPVVYDRGSNRSGINSRFPVKYDTGYHYEQRLGPQGKPSSIDITKYRRNV